MRRDGLYRLVVLVVHLEFFLLIDRIRYLAAHDHAFVEHQAAQYLAQVRVLADPLGNNVPRTFQRFFRARHAEFDIHKSGCKVLQRLRGRLLLPEVGR